MNPSLPLGQCDSTEEMTMTPGFDVSLMLDPQTGNDPIEATARLPIVPRKGDRIEVWDGQGDWANPDEHGGIRRPGGSDWLVVEDVVLCSYAPERIEVWVRIEGYDLAVAERLMDAVKKGEKP
jgi:hypothetical protein